MALTRNAAHLPPDLSYVLDGAAEVGEILGCHYAALTLYGSAAEIDRIFENPDYPDLPGWRRGRRRLGALGLVRYANGIIAEMDQVEREAMGSYAYAHARQLVGEYASFLAAWNFEDEIKGGCQLPFRRHLRGTVSGKPSSGARRRLYGPRAIRRYVKLYDDMDWLRTVISETLDAVPVPISLRGGQEFNRRMETHLRETREAEFRAMVRNGAGRAAPSREAVRKRRGVIRRASVMAAAVLGASTVSAFARGESITIPGQEVAFEIRAAASLATEGHDGLKIALLDKSGARLSGLCVYHEGTPALDQLTAFALRIAAGEEAEIIKVGNLYGIEEPAREHPLLADRLKPTPIFLGDAAEPLLIDPIREPALDRFLRRDAFRRATDLYAAETAPLYREAVAVRLAGRRAPLLLRDWPDA